MDESFLKSTNPELYDACPRRGGTLTIPDVCDRTKMKNPLLKFLAGSSGVQIEEPPKLEPPTLPSQAKIKAVCKEFPWIFETDESKAPSEICEEGISNAFQTSVYLLTVAIGTIMLLSKGYDKIGQIYLKWTHRYLQCVKDNQGQLPPNIKKLLNHIQMVTGGTIPYEMSDDEDSGDGSKGQAVAGDGKQSSAATDESKGEVPDVAAKESQLPEKENVASEAAEEVIEAVIRQVNMMTGEEGSAIKIAPESTEEASPVPEGIQSGDTKATNTEAKVTRFSDIPLFGDVPRPKTSEKATKVCAAIQSLLDIQERKQHKCVTWKKAVGTFTMN